MTRCGPAFNKAILYETVKSEKNKISISFIFGKHSNKKRNFCDIIKYEIQGCRGFSAALYPTYCAG